MMPIFKSQLALYMALISGLWLASGVAVFAQNYVPVDGYGGQQVTVNFDALDDGAADPYSTTPFSNPGMVLQEDVPAVVNPAHMAQVTPPLLAPPTPRPVATPVFESTAPLPIIQPPTSLPPSVKPLGTTVASKPLPVTPVAPAPVKPAFKPVAPVVANLPVPSPAPAPVAKAIPLPTPPLSAAPQTMPASVPATPTLPTLAQMPVSAMPVAPIKAEALPDPAVAARKQANDAANTTQQIIFMVDSDMLTAQGRQQLANIGQLLAQESGTRVQLRAFAMGTPETASDARRLSLARGLAVRAQLLQLGAKPAQIDVRALGSGGGGINPATGAPTPADRVDVVVLR